MKRLPEKLMMAAIILSCGFVAHSEPSAQHTMVKRAVPRQLHSWQVPPGTATAMHSARAAKALGAAAELP